MNKKIRVGLIFGGNSSEYEVSIISGRNIYKAIDKEKYDVYPMWITNTGFLASDADSRKVLEDPTYQIENPRTVTNISNVIELSNRPEIDVFFPIVHGNLGEDGCLQGLLRILDKPFVGDDVLAAAITMDKELNKIMAQRAGVPVAKWISIKRFEYDDAKNEKLSYDYVSQQLGTDLFVKPSNQGSSVGISHVTSNELNALPGFTNISMYPKLFEEAGIPYAELITKLLDYAVARYNHKKTLLHKHD